MRNLHDIPKAMSNELSIKIALSDEASEFISKSFKARREKNPKYSLRAFAKFLGVDHSHLAKVLKGQSEFSQRAKLKCLQRLGACPDLIKNLKNKQGLHVYDEISDDDFEFLSNWAHYAILELMTLPDFQVSSKSISRRLGITVKEASACLHRLISLGFISNTESGFRLVKVNNTFYPSKKTTKAKVNFQQELLSLSQESLLNDPIDERDHSSVILALNKYEMEMFKKWITNARRQLTQEFQKNKEFSDVYCLQISFFPMTKRL